MYKRQAKFLADHSADYKIHLTSLDGGFENSFSPTYRIVAVSYTHLRAHETVLDLVCRLLLETKKTPHTHTHTYITTATIRTYRCYNQDT